MELTGEELIAQPLQRVWDSLNDPQVLKACLPGCEEISKTAENEYKVVLSAAVGPVKARFTGQLLLSNLDPPNSYSLAFEGAGGAAGFAKGGATVRLAEAGAATKLAYEAKATIGGKIAQVGSRLIDGVARRIAAEFFARFSQLVTAPDPAQEPSPEALSAASASPRFATAEVPTGALRSKAGPGSWVFPALAVLVAAALFTWYSRSRR